MTACRRAIMENIGSPYAEGDGEEFPSHRVRLSILSRPLLGLFFLSAFGVLLLGFLDDADASLPGPKRALPGHEKLIESVIYAADGRTLISCGWDRMVRFWDVEEGGDHWGRETAALPHETHVFSMALTRDGRFLGTGGVQRFTIWERGPGGGWRKALEERGMAHRSVAAAPDGRTLATGAADGYVKLWDLATLRPTTIRPGIADEIREVAFSPDGTFLVACGFNGQLRGWRLSPGAEPEPLPFECWSVVAFAMSPTADTLAIASTDGSENAVSLRELRTGKEVFRVPGCERGHNILAFSPDGHLLACGDKDNTIRLRDAVTGAHLDSLNDQLGWIKALAFSPDGRRIAFGGKDGMVRFRDVPVGLDGRVTANPMQVSAPVTARNPGAGRT